MVECLLGMHKALVPPPALCKSGKMVHASVPTFGRKKQEAQKFRVILSYEASARISWAT